MLTSLFCLSPQTRLHLLNNETDRPLRASPSLPLPPADMAGTGRVVSRNSNDILKSTTIPVSPLASGHVSRAELNDPGLHGSAQFQHAQRDEGPYKIGPETYVPPVWPSRTTTDEPPEGTASGPVGGRIHSQDNGAAALFSLNGSMIMSGLCLAVAVSFV